MQIDVNDQLNCLISSLMQGQWRHTHVHLLLSAAQLIIGFKGEFQIIILASHREANIIKLEAKFPHEDKYLATRRFGKPMP